MDVATDSPGNQTAPAGANGRGAVGHVAGIVDSAAQLADAQVRLWLAEIRSLAGRVVLAVLLSVLAIILAIATAAFLYAGVFHFLTDYLQVPTAWALLIFAGVHGLAAGVLAVLALGMLKRGATDLTGRRKT